MKPPASGNGLDLKLFQRPVGSVPRLRFTWLAPTPLGSAVLCRGLGVVRLTHSYDECPKSIDGLTRDGWRSARRRHNQGMAGRHSRHQGRTLDATMIDFAGARPGASRTHCTSSGLLTSRAQWSNVAASRWQSPLPLLECGLSLARKILPWWPKVSRADAHITGFPAEY